jgi:hypothetical protein
LKIRLLPPIIDKGGIWKCGYFYEDGCSFAECRSELYWLRAIFGDTEIGVRQSLTARHITQSFLDSPPTLTAVHSLSTISTQDVLITGVFHGCSVFGDSLLFGGTFCGSSVRWTCWFDKEEFDQKNCNWRSCRFQNLRLRTQNNMVDSRGHGESA